MKKTISIFLCLALLIGVLSGCGGAMSAAQTSETSAGAAAAATSAETAAGTGLTVYCFSAGKADAILLTTENSTVLIDAGEKGFGKEILSYLEQQGITGIDYMIITHFDQDHVGGAAKVLNNISVGTVLQSNCPKDSEEYEKYVKALSSAAIEPVTVQDTYTFTLDGVSYVVDPPRKTDYDQDDSNNSSLIVSVYNGSTSLLFAGDAQTERLEEFLEAGCGSYDFLKIPHHGKEEPMLEQLLQAVSPAFAVITSSDEEPEDESITALLASAGVETFLTREAPVVITSDGTVLQAGYTTE